MSNPTGCGKINLPTSNFTIQERTSTSGTVTGNASINSQVSINGSTDLSQIITGNNGACVLSITYESMDGIARNSVVYAFGQGPEGLGSGTLHLEFYTQNTGPNDPHTLGLTSSTPSCHDDKFSDGSNLLTIKWYSP
jgi:hypothetical protein